MNDRLISKLPAATTIIIAIILLGYNWYLTPERALVWGLVMAGMFAALIGLTIVRARTSPENATASTINASMFAGALIIVASLSAAAAGANGIVSPGIEKRVFGIIMSVLLIVTGNYLPNILRPLDAHNCDPAKTKAAERFAGWCFVVAGILGLFAWVLLDTDYAKLTFAILGLGAFGLVVLRWLGAFSKRNGVQS